MNRTCALCVLFLLVDWAASPTRATAQMCPGVSQTVPSEAQASFRAFIAPQIQGHPAAQRVRLEHYMQSGNWSAVFAQAPGAERGVFFFRINRNGPAFRAVWGGVPSGDSTEEIAKWPMSLDPQFPRALALCFANAVEAGQ